jgi:DNA-binding transcriptional LysR family regulator
MRSRSQIDGKIVRAIRFWHPRRTVGAPFFRYHQHTSQDGPIMKLNQLRDMVAIADKGSLRAAARYLGLAQPALTRSVRALEHELGTTLFERDARGMVLTPRGQLFYQRAKAVVNELRRAREEIEQTSGDMQGTVVVGLSIMPHVGMLPQALPAFRRQFPHVTLKVIEGLYPAMEAGLRDGSIDFYVRIPARCTRAGLAGRTVVRQHPHHRRPQRAPAVDGDVDPRPGRRRLGNHIRGLQRHRGPGSAVHPLRHGRTPGDAPGGFRHVRHGVRGVWRLVGHSARAMERLSASTGNAAGNPDPRGIASSRDWVYQAARSSAHPCGGGVLRPASSAFWMSPISCICKGSS